MTTPTDNAKRVSKANPFEKPGDDSDLQPPLPSAIIPGQEFVLVLAELSSARSRITDLETQLKQSEQGRREDIERLLRELMEARITIAKLEAAKITSPEPPQSADRPQTPDGNP